jgi:hypothetical protein
MQSPSHHSALRPHSRRSFKITPELFAERLLKDNLLHAKEKAPAQQPVDDSGPVNIGTVMRNEKIENARSIASAIGEQRQQKAATSSLMHNALVERLEAKLLTNEMECTELRKLAEANKRGIPVSLASLKLGFQPEKDSCVGYNFLLKEEACTNVRRLLTCARKRDTHGDTDTAWTTQTTAPRSILRKRAFAGKKSVSWGA